MQHSQHVDVIHPRDVTDPELLKTRHRPQSQSRERRIEGRSWSSDLGELGQLRKCLLCFVQETLCGSRTVLGDEQRTLEQVGLGGGTERRREGSFRGSLRQTLDELAAERFPVSLRELAPGTRSSRLEKEGFKVLPGLSLLILPDQVANVLAHSAVASGLDSGIDETRETARATAQFLPRARVGVAVQSEAKHEQARRAQAQLPSRDDQGHRDAKMSGRELRHSFSDFGVDSDEARSIHAVLECCSRRGRRLRPASDSGSRCRHRWTGWRKHQGACRRWRYEGASFRCARPVELARLNAGRS